MGRVSLWRVRAFIVAEKRRNGRGAKGGRKKGAAWPGEDIRRDAGGPGMLREAVRGR